MTVGEQIFRLRTARGMSQEALASALQVSRQSVSKWETGGSVPELDKLVKLSELFDVTLDELVRGAPQTERPAPEAEAERPAAPETPDTTRSRSAPRRIAGGLLLLLAVLLALLPLLLAGSLAGFVLAIPFLLSGAVCLTARRRAGLWCGWVWYLSLTAYFRWATGISWTLVWMTPGYQPEWNYARLLLAWALLAMTAAMLAGTLYAFRSERIRPTQRRTALLTAGWAAWLAAPQMMQAVVFRVWLAALTDASSYSGMAVYRLVSALWEYLRFFALSALAVYTLALLRGRRSAEELL